MVESMWRTQAYYKSSPWRGTWEGEGGGVLLNQAPHLLDRYAWLCGMPESLSANCDTTLHEIEVEDTASAILRHKNGAHGYIHINTIESPAISRTVISCDRGRIVIENGAVRLTRLRDSIQDKTAHDPRPMGDLESETYDMSPGQLSFQQLLDAFYGNFLASVNGEAALVCPGEEGRNAVELANAMILSSISGKAISIPLSRNEYTQFIQKMIRSRAKVG